MSQDRARLVEGKRPWSFTLSGGEVEAGSPRKLPRHDLGVGSSQEASFAGSSSDFQTVSQYGPGSLLVSDNQSDVGLLVDPNDCEDAQPLEMDVDDGTVSWGMYSITHGLCRSSIRLRLLLSF